MGYFSIREFFAELWWLVTFFWGAVRGKPKPIPAKPASVPPVDHELAKRSYMSARNSLGEKKYDVIVIGSGMGGLSCASLLSREGKKVLVLEQHDVAGGCTHVFVDGRGGDTQFEFDTGVHYVGGMHDPLNVPRIALDAVTGSTVEWHEMDAAYDVLVFPDEDGTGNKWKTYSHVKGSDAWVRNIAEAFPGEEETIQTFYNRCREAHKSFQLFAMLKLLPPKISGLVMRWTAAAKRFLGYTTLTAQQVVDELTDNEKLKAVLLHTYGDYGLPPEEAPFLLHAALITHYAQGASYPVGGSGVLAPRIIDVIQRAGGDVLVRARVRNIVMRNGRACGVVMDKTGDKIYAPTIVSACGFRRTFGTLLPADVSRAYGYADLAERKGAGEIKQGAGHVYAFLGLDRTAEELKLPSANWWVYSGYDHNRIYKDYARDGLDGDINGMFLSFPSAKDPEYTQRFPGRGCAIVVAEAPFEVFAPFAGERVKHRGDEYEALKARYATRLEEALYEHFPQCRGHVVYKDAATPLTNNYYLNAIAGESYGMEHTAARFAEASLNVHTFVPGLFLTGQDALTCGFVGALMSGVLTTAAITGRHILGDLRAERRRRKKAMAAGKKAQ